jgi:hypothetical protein
MPRRPRDQFEIARATKSDEATAKHLAAWLAKKRAVERQLVSLGRVSKMPLSAMVARDCPREGNEQ